MIKQHMMLALVGTALLATPALAQTSTSPTGNSNAPAASASTNAGGQFMSQAQAGQWRASKLVGVDIYGSNNEKIGDVNEVLLDKSGNAQAVVIGVGGFLGVGQKDVAVPFSAVQWKDTPRPSASASSSGSSSNAGGMTSTSGAGSASSSASTTKVMDYPDHGMVSMTKEQLQNAPEFKYASDTASNSGSSSTSRPAAPAGSTR